MGQQNKAKVSIVTPCYNKESFIGKMLASVCAQKWSNIELILVYDASPDRTLAVIEEWLPKLRERGYEVVLLKRDKPMGLPAALRDGMRRMTGDYFCTVDCDDTIDPEYVSEMAGFLDDNKDYAWAVCDFIYVFGENDKKKHTDRSPILSGYSLSENYLMKRIATAVWRYMVRTEYLLECGLPESMAVEPRISQELQLFLPLAEGGGKIQHIQKCLYYYDTIHMEELSKISVPKADVIGRECFLLCIKTIARLSVSDERKQRLYTISSIFWLHPFLAYVNQREKTEDPSHDFRNIIQVFIQTIFNPAPEINALDIIDAVRFPMLLRAIENSIDGSVIEPIKLKSENSRIIGYGALGKAASKRMPVITGTPLRPDVLWDKNAKTGDEVCQIPVTIPDFESLNSDDIVLIFPVAHEVVEEVKEALSPYGCHAIDNDSLWDYLSFYYYPQLYECKHTGTEYKNLLRAKGMDLDFSE
jgi:hypothetical protein